MMSLPFAIPVKMSRRITLSIWIVTLAMVFLLLFAYALPQDFSNRSEPYATFVCISFFGRVLSFQFGLVFGILAIVALAARSTRLLLLNLAMAAVCLRSTPGNLLPHHPPPAIGPVLRVMSMNLKYTHDHADLIGDQIKKYNPDVLAIEDYTPFAQTAIEKTVGEKYPYRAFYFNYLQGLAFYSRLPLQSKPTTSFSAINRQMRAVVLFHDHPIAIYVEHPFSPRSKRRIINNRLAMLDLAGAIQKEKLPVIAVGDFNFTDTTPNEALLKHVGLADGFEQAGLGRGSTWPVSPRWMAWLPGVRIDHVFFSSQFVCSGFEVGSYDGSDHLPIVADVSIRD